MNILIYHIYYYFGFTLFSIIFLIVKYNKEKNKINFKKNKLAKEALYTGINNSKSKKSEKTLFSLSKFSKDEKNHYIKFLLLIAFIHMLSEILMFYFEQIYLNNVCFWMLEIIFIHLFLLKENSYHLYSHQILSFAIIIFFGFGVKLMGAFLPRCIYKVVDYVLIPNMPEEYNDMIKKSTDAVNEKGLRFYRNSFKVSPKQNLYYLFIIIASIGYLIGFVLHSFSIVKIRYLINIKYISPYLIILCIGLFGFISNIIDLNYI